MIDPAGPGFHLAITLVAILYSAVGHGGASGYLALLSMTALAGRPAATLALTMNLGVASISFAAFQRARHFRWEILWPFLVFSLPMAFLGGRLHVPGSVHKALVALALGAAGLWLLLGARRPSNDPPRPIRLGVALPVGAGIGLLSGLVGVGGGIFLSPMLLLARWADPKQTAAVSAVFIVLNSLAGLLARTSSDWALVGPHGSLIACAVLGSLAGGLLGAFRATRPQLRVALGLVLLLAIGKLVGG